MVGDCQVRYMNRAYCNRDKKTRIRVCFRGARVGCVIDRMDGISSGNGNKLGVCLSAGRKRKKEKVGVRS